MNTIDHFDVRWQVLESAILAPSPHNTQPWRIACEGKDRILISLDFERLIPGCDPIGRQALISTGAFLENLDLAAKSAGYRADIDLFPLGWPDARKLPREPVARVDLVREPDMVPDPLFHQVPLRHTNRRRFSRTEIPLEAAGEITAAYEYSLVPLGFSHDPACIRAVAEMATEAMMVELADERRSRETVEYFRFTDEEAERSPDGFGLAQSGYGKLARFLIGRLIVTRKKATASPKSFCRMAWKSAEVQSRHAGAIAWLSTKGDHRVDQVRAGRAFQRVHLKATELGIALHPMTQLLADYPEMADRRSRLHEFLGIPDTHTVQMLFRMGYAPPVPAAPRRKATDLVIS